MDKRRVEKHGGGVQGEGNYDAAREYIERMRRFARGGRVDAAARAAQLKDDQEAAELKQAEEAGRRRAAHVRNRAPRRG